MTPTNTTHPEQPSGVLSLADIANRTGVSLDLLRAKLRTNPVLRSLFRQLGRVHALPASSLPRVVELLAQRAAGATAPGV